jgi:hypothetical protein
MSKASVHGSELLQAGLIWRVGDGASITVGDDNWIPRAGAQRPLGRREEGCPNRVQDLIVSEGGAWDEEKVRRYFFDIDANDAMDVTVPTALNEDAKQSGSFRSRSCFFRCPPAKKKVSSDTPLDKKKKRCVMVHSSLLVSEILKSIN